MFRGFYLITPLIANNYITLLSLGVLFDTTDLLYMYIRIYNLYVIY